MHLPLTIAGRVSSKSLPADPFRGLQTESAGYNMHQAGFGINSRRTSAKRQLTLKEFFGEQ